MPKTLLVEPGFADMLRVNGLTDFDAFMRREPSGPAVSEHWNRHTVPLDLDCNGAIRRLYLKRMLRPQPEHVLGAVLHLHRPVAQPVSEWHNIVALNAAGVPTMTRVAAGQRTRLGVPQEGFLLVEEVPTPHTLADWLAAARSENLKSDISNQPDRTLSGNKNVANDSRNIRIPHGQAKTLDRATPGLPTKKASPGNIPQSAIPNLQSPEPWLLRRLFLELGMLAGQMDQAGLLWLDVEPKHIFCRLDPNGVRGGRWQFWLIDVERLDHRGPGRQQHAMTTLFADMLDPLCCFSPARNVGPFDLLIFRGALRAGTVERLRVAAQDAVAADEIAFLKKLAKMRGLRKRRAPFGTLPACGPTLQSGGLTIVEPHLQPLRDAGLATFDALLAARNGATLTKPSLESWRTRDRVQLETPGNASATFYLKRYVEPPASAQRRRRRDADPLHSTAAAEKAAIERLTDAGIPTTRWAAFGERMKGEHEVSSLLLLQEVPGESLERLVHRWTLNAAPPPPRTRHAVIAQLADMVRRMHDENLFHRDLYLSHVFLSLQDGAPQLHLIDLARLTRRRCRQFRWRIKDLAALEYSSPRPLITRADRVRFLRAYLGGAAGRRGMAGRQLTVVPRVRTKNGQYVNRITLDSRDSLAALIRAVRRRVRRMARHDAKHGRSGVLPRTPEPALR